MHDYGLEVFRLRLVSAHLMELSALMTTEFQHCWVSGRCGLQKAVCSASIKDLSVQYFETIKIHNLGQKGQKCVGTNIKTLW